MATIRTLRGLAGSVPSASSPTPVASPCRRPCGKRPRPGGRHSVSRHSMHGRAVVAAAAATAASPPVAAAGLAAYPYPDRQLQRLGSSNGSSGGAGAGAGGAASSKVWLAACVRHIAASAPARTPQLQLVHAGGPGGGHSFQTIPVSREVADDPGAWATLATHVRSSGAVGLVLVRPIASPEQHCAYASASRAAPDACAPGRTPAEAAAAAVGGGGSMEGHVGECCDGGHGGSAHNAAAGPHAHAHAHAAPAAATAGGGGGASFGSSSSSTQYYGLVVQGAVGSDADGCWVLKTSRSDAGTCACTHFALTRVCLGQPLAEQLRDAWLVRA